ncbi:hypothetical protein HYC85_003972 [Camellia sinensis]|uniref:Protein MULTIPOLAR SPINDLE 1 n=1 Tax=Camellia sinensis TaxID=4442 RepID=A0A7J7HWE6_CAMSI|nr:hypothetical protein HYC85_003972 [Camellia sinensis]
MASSEEQAKTDSNTSLKLAITMALLRSKLLQKLPPPPPPPPPHLHHPSASPSSQSTSQKWKRKAKDRKQELLRLKEDLKQAEDNSQCDLFPQSASCVCYFFDKLGELNPNRFLDSSDRRFNDVLRRRFLRQGCNSEDETEQLRASVDFLVELCESVCPDKVEEMNFAKWSHQAVDFILAALKNILPKGKNTELLEGIISSLIVRLVRIMCTTSQGDELHHCDTGAQFYVQHLIRKLGSEPYIGQRVILSVSEGISVLAESLLFMDPFDDSFPSMHDCMYMMIQLIEFLVSDYLLSWSSSEVFDIRLFEEWVASVLHGRKALELLESRNGLYVLYMDRVIGVLAKQTGQFSSLQKLNPEILAKLFS